MPQNRSPVSCARAASKAKAKMQPYREGGASQKEAFNFGTFSRYSVQKSANGGANWQWQGQDKKKGNDSIDQLLAE